MPGEKNGFYLDVQEFWDSILKKEVGDYTPMEIFPPGSDNIDITNIFSYICELLTKVYRSKTSFLATNNSKIQKKIRQKGFEKSKVTPRHFSIYNYQYFKCKSRG